MPIEIAPKKAVTGVSLGTDILFYFSIALLLIVVGSYLFLSDLERQLQNEILKLTEVVNQEIRAHREDEFFLKEQETRIKDFGYLIGAHSDASIFFDYLERVTHPKVWFDSIELDADNLRVSLTGIAESFLVLGQQILALKEDHAFREVNLNSFSLEEEGVIFDLEIFVSPIIFKIQTDNE